MKLVNQSQTDNYFQHTFVIGPHGDFLLDFVGRFESLQEDFDTICDRIGIERSTLPHTNKYDHRFYKTYYTKETKRLVAEKYKEDIALLGYEF